MGGAENIAKAPFLQSSVMINVDSEESGSICVGCAGGFERKLFLNLHRSPVGADEEGKVAIELHLHSLLGGHTGIDIHKGRANALILLARLLNAALTAKVDLQLLSIHGGNAPNAIPRDATWSVLLPVSQRATFEQVTAATFDRFLSEFKDIERKLAPGSEEGPHAKWVQPMRLQQKDVPVSGAFATSVEEARKIVALLLLVPHGPLKINVDLDHAVDTSISFSLLALPATPAADGKDKLIVHVFSRSAFEADMKVSMRFRV